MTQKKITLAHALARAQASADRIDKDSRNDFARFDYTSAESMMAMWTVIGEAHGLSLYPAALNIEGDNLRTCWVLEHAASGTNREIRMDWPIVEAKGKPRDKAVASARTSSLGYLIRDLLVAPRVHPTDDMDHPRWSMPEKAPQSPPKPSKPPAPVNGRPWHAEHAQAILEIPGQPSPDEVEAIVRNRSGVEVSTMDPGRIPGVLKFIARGEGQRMLDEMRGER